jgi:hypothetical protein
MGQKVRIHGEKSQWYVNCFGNNVSQQILNTINQRNPELTSTRLVFWYQENSTCLGDGSSSADHSFYFTPIGQCGSADKVSWFYKLYPTEIIHAYQSFVDLQGF